MYLFIDLAHLPYWLAVILMQFIGALVFYPIDKFIFKKEHKPINKQETIMLLNCLVNLQHGGLPKDLTEEEVNLLKKHYGKNWFERLGYDKTHYKRPVNA